MDEAFFGRAIGKGDGLFNSGRGFGFFSGADGNFKAAKEFLVMKRLAVRTAKGAACGWGDWHINLG